MYPNSKNPTYLNFIDNVNTNVVNHVNWKNYFNLTSENKITVQNVTLKLIKSSINLRIKLSDEELVNLISSLCRRNEVLENFEFAQVLLDVKTNFHSINESIKPQKRKPKSLQVKRKIDEK